MSSRFCISCGRTVTKGQKYCAADGSLVENQEMGLIKNCINCEILLPEIALYCSSCGYPQSITSKDE